MINVDMKGKQAFSKRGFTLIELLVTIAIISVLATLLMVNFVGVRQRGRDSQRKANLFQLQSALELYRSDAGSYPLTASWPACGTALSNGSAVYMQEVPCDPTTDAGYVYTSDGTTYTIISCLENDQDSDKDATVDSTCSAPTFPASFTLHNP